VVARNSTFAYKGRASDIRTIARELDATHIVEGSVRRAGTQVRSYRPAHRRRDRPPHLGGAV